MVIEKSNNDQNIFHPNREVDLTDELSLTVTAVNSIHFLPGCCSKLIQYPVFRAGRTYTGGTGQNVTIRRIKYI